MLPSVEPRSGSGNLGTSSDKVFVLRDIRPGLLVFRGVDVPGDVRGAFSIDSFDDVLFWTSRSPSRELIINVSLLSFTSSWEMGRDGWY